MKTRLTLDAELRTILGSNNCYFQPPASKKMTYPAIVYEKAKSQIMHADDKTYLHRTKYMITSISANPDTTIPDDLVNHFDYCYLDRHFTSDGLNHDVLVLYY